LTVSIGLCLLAYGASSWVYRGKIGNLISNNDTLEKKHNAEVHHLERRIENLDEDNARLRLLHKEKTRKVFVQVIEAPYHRIDYAMPIKQLLDEKPEYLILEKHNLVKLHGDSNHTSVSSTGTATKLWDDVIEETIRGVSKVIQPYYKK
jgi:hypothetical protein